MSTNTWDWFIAASEHLRARPSGEQDPGSFTLLAVALYWARARGTEWETGKNTTHSQRRAAYLLGAHHNTIGRAIRFWESRGFMEISKRRFDTSLVIDLVIPGPLVAAAPLPRRADFPDLESFLDALEGHADKRGAA